MCVNHRKTYNLATGRRCFPPSLLTIFTCEYAALRRNDSIKRLHWCRFHMARFKTENTWKRKSLRDWLRDINRRQTQCVLDPKIYHESHRDTYSPLCFTSEVFRTGFSSFTSKRSFALKKVFSCVFFSFFENMFLRSFFSFSLTGWPCSPNFSSYKLVHECRRLVDSRGGSKERFWKNRVFCLDISPSVETSRTLRSRSQRLCTLSLKVSVKAYLQQ